MTKDHDGHARILDTVAKITADLACNLFQEAGIPSIQHGPDFDVAELGAAGHGMLRGTSVFVPQDAPERARGILEDAWGADWEKAGPDQV